MVGFGVFEAKSRVASRGSTGPANRLFFAEVRKAEEIRRFPLVLEKRVRNAGYAALWRGQRWLLDMHLKNGGNTRDPTRCLRVYFFWDDDERQVVVGSLPGHLESRLS